MKQKQMTAIAVACGLVCAACVALFMMSVQNEADAARAEVLARFGGEQVEAYVATRDIAAGERLDVSSVETRTWVSDLLPENAIRSTADAVGNVATSPIFKGEVITAGRFEAELDLLEVPDGKQAVSVPAKPVQAVGGAIRPGMSIDIYSSGDSATMAIARNVSVLDTSAGQAGILSSSDNGWITIAVDSEKVQEIIAASNKTSLYFTLPGEPFEGEGENSGAESSDSADVEQSESGDVASAEASSSNASALPAQGDSGEKNTGGGR